MGRPRTPTKLLEFRGSFKKDPQRKRESEPIPTGEIGNPPEHFDAELRAMWEKIVDEAAPGVLTNSDRLHVEILCQLMVEYREDPRGFSGSKLSQLSTALGRIGMNSADRSKLSVGGKAKAKNPYADL